VENHGSNFVKAVKVECGFYQGDQLISSGFTFLENIEPGATGFHYVGGDNASNATSAKCRFVSFR
jgi:hypothetical protein